MAWSRTWRPTRLKKSAVFGRDYNHHRTDQGGIEINKVTKEAELYLKDFYILNEARKELDLILDNLVDQVYEILESEKEYLSNDEYDWNTWKNKAKPGTMQIYLKPKSSFTTFVERNQTDIYVAYNDIRHTSRIKDSLSVEIDVHCTRRAKELRTILNNESLKLFGTKATVFYYPSIQPEEMDNTVDEIANQMVDCCQRINQILANLRNKQVDK